LYLCGVKNKYNKKMKKFKKGYFNKLIKRETIKIKPASSSPLNMVDAPLFASSVGVLRRLYPINSK